MLELVMFESSTVGAKRKCIVPSQRERGRTAVGVWCRPRGVSGEGL